MRCPTVMRGCEVHIMCCSAPHQMVMRPTLDVEGNCSHIERLCSRIADQVLGQLRTKSLYLIYRQSFDCRLTAAHADYRDCPSLSVVLVNNSPSGYSIPAVLHEMCSLTQQDASCAVATGNTAAIGSVTL
ncbi:hypothetical protein ABBQ32_002564 [Trebouxia sp. C0010 RCD-2024]